MFPPQSATRPCTRVYHDWCQVPLGASWHAGIGALQSGQLMLVHPCCRSSGAIPGRVCDVYEPLHTWVRWWSACGGTRGGLASVEYPAKCRTGSGRRAKEHRIELTNQICPSPAGARPRDCRASRCATARVVPSGKPGDDLFRIVLADGTSTPLRRSGRQIVPLERRVAQPADRSCRISLRAAASKSR